MSNLREYPIEYFSNKNFDIPSLKSEIEANVLTNTIMNMVDIGTSVIVVMQNSISEEEVIVLDTVVSSHIGDTLKIYRDIVRRAIEFFQESMIDFAGENVAMGITQAGLTKDVNDYLKNVALYGATGSLYEVVAEINTLISNGIPSEFSPFVTEDRMAVLRDRVLTYLGEI